MSLSHWVVGTVGAMIVIGGALAVIAIKVSVWNECRGGGHSFFYCWHVMGGS